MSTKSATREPESGGSSPGNLSASSAWAPVVSFPPYLVLPGAGRPSQHRPWFLGFGLWWGIATEMREDACTDDTLEKCFTRFSLLLDIYQEHDVTMYAMVAAPLFASSY